jgi:hypothetical protein
MVVAPFWVQPKSIKESQPQRTQRAQRKTKFLFEKKKPLLPSFAFFALFAVNVLFTPCPRR